jgi:hypothetical protein
MNQSRFDVIVKNRAQQRVSERIERFRYKLAEAFKELGPEFQPGYYNGWLPHDIKDDVRLVLSNVANGGYFDPLDKPQGSQTLAQVVWPKCMWDNEESAVEKELLATMDEMQRALIAPPPDDNSPRHK